MTVIVQHTIRADRENSSSGNAPRVAAGDYGFLRGAGVIIFRPDIVVAILSINVQDPDRERIITSRNIVRLVRRVVCRVTRRRVLGNQLCLGHPKFGTEVVVDIVDLPGA